MTERLAVGIDIGGTKVAYALADQTGNIYNTHTIAMHADLTPEDIAEGVQSVLDGHALNDITGIGIGVPGRIDVSAGVVMNAVNLGWKHINLVDRMKQSLDVPIYLEMDARAALLGELTFGAAKGVGSVVQVAIGTGLGGAAYINGDLVRGAHLFAMELGHLHMRGWQRACSCGGVGCVETILSGQGIMHGINAYREDYPNSPLAQSNNPTTYDWIQALPTSDALAQRILQDVQQVWHDLLNMIYVTLNPEIVVLSGGMGLAIADYLAADLDTVLHEAPYCPIDFPVTVRTSILESSALGASALVWHNS